jgi:hypothetical protein
MGFFFNIFHLGIIYLLRKDIGVGEWSENGNSPLLYIILYVGDWVVLKSPEISLRNI